MKKELKMYKVILQLSNIILLIFLIGCCDSFKEDTKEQVYLNSLNSLKKPAIKYNGDHWYIYMLDHEKSWFEISRNGFDIIEYLMQFENDTSCNIIYHGLKIPIGYYEDRVVYIKAISKPENRIYALYMICAIYYNNYYFASDKILYINNKDSLLYTEGGRYIKKGEYADNSNNEIMLAWKTVKEWYNQYHIMGIDSVRRRQIRPFLNSDIYWYGEEGGFVNSNYSHKIVVNKEEI